jgi:hypothetical protein
MAACLPGECVSGTTLPHHASVDLGRITTREQTANAGKIILDKRTGAWTSTDATIAATQRMAFPIKYLLFIRLLSIVFPDL